MVRSVVLFYRSKDIEYRGSVCTDLFFLSESWGIVGSKMVMHVNSHAMRTIFAIWSSSEEIGKVGEVIGRPNPTHEKIMNLFVYTPSRTPGSEGFRSTRRVQPCQSRDTYAELSEVADALIREYGVGEVTFSNPTAFHWLWWFLGVELERRPKFETEKEMKERREREREERESAERERAEREREKREKEERVREEREREEREREEREKEERELERREREEREREGQKLGKIRIPGGKCRSSGTSEQVTTVNDENAHVSGDLSHSSPSTSPAPNVTNETSIPPTGSTNTSTNPAQPEVFPTSTTWTFPSSQPSSSFMNAWPPAPPPSEANARNSTGGSQANFARPASGPASPSGSAGHRASAFAKTARRKKSSVATTGGGFTFISMNTGTASSAGTSPWPFATSNVQATATRTTEANGLSGAPSGMATTTSSVPPLDGTSAESTPLSDFGRRETSTGSASSTPVFTNDAGVTSPTTSIPPITNDHSRTSSKKSSFLSSLRLGNTNASTSTQDPNQSQAYAFPDTHPSSGDGIGTSTQFDGGATEFKPPPNRPSNPFSSPGTWNYRTTTSTPIVTASNGTSSTPASASKLCTSPSPQFPFGKRDAYIPNTAHTSDGTPTPSVDATYPASQQQFGTKDHTASPIPTTEASDAAPSSSSTVDATTESNAWPNASSAASPFGAAAAQPATDSNTSNETSEPSADAS